MASQGDTVVLCTVVGAKEARSDQSFYPLTVNYQERMYASGKIPGSFFRREGRPTEKETLTSRLIDRPIRPLFPKGFMNEIQVVATVLSVAKGVDPDILAMVGCSAALAVSGVPFAGPIGAARVGLLDDSYVLNPTLEQLESSELNMVVAGTKEAVLMVESEAKELSEDMMLGAVLFAHEQAQVQISAIESLARDAGTVAWEFEAPAVDAELSKAIEDAMLADVQTTYQIQDKQERTSALQQLRDKAKAALATGEENGWDEGDVIDGLDRLQKAVVRKRILDGEARIDGRPHDQVRQLETEVGLLPQAHGSALFQRGETQAIVAATLGTSRDSQLIEDLEATTYEQFLLHYNFPPYSVGEAGRMGAPGRREIGHGRLAKRGLLAVMPSTEDFPYTIRVVSEITESNGSSSMASVCGTSLALMDAGVPISAPVAGVAMGLVLEGDQSTVLTDILGDEDHLGDMDFKVAGTRVGVTALQMDIKVAGITESIMEQALNQAHGARIHILDHMDQTIKTPRAEISKNAPAVIQMRVDREKIGSVIGKGGATIRGLEEKFEIKLELDDDGTVMIYGDNRESALEAQAEIDLLVADVEMGMVYNGTVQRIESFGAIVEILPGKTGLLHISEISHERINKIEDVLSNGQLVGVKVTRIDAARGRISLSMKDIEQPDQDEAVVAD